MKKLKISCYVILFVSLMFFSSSMVNAKEEKANEFQKEAQFVGAESCTLCHEEVVEGYKRSTHSGTILDAGGNVEGESCEACHGPGSLHVDSGGDKKMITRYSAENCFSCHMDKRAQFQLQFHHPVPEGRMACTDCHNVHDISAEMRSITSLDRPNEQCFKCHKEFKGPYVFEHDPMRESCQICHEVHGGVYEKMLVASQSSLCLRCHWEQSVNTTASRIGGVPHGTISDTGTSNYKIGQGEECIDHHRAVHGSNIWRTFNR